MQMLGTIEGAQMAAVQGGAMGVLLTPKHLYNLQKRKTQLAGFKDAGEFWQDPEMAQPQAPQAPPPDPAAQADQAKQQADVEKFHAQAQLDREKMDKELAFKADQAERDRALQVFMADMAKADPDKESREAEEEASRQEVEQLAGTVQAVAQTVAAQAAGGIKIVRDQAGRPIEAITPLGKRAIQTDEAGRVIGLGGIQ
jgi:hypothetical protein